MSEGAEGGSQNRPVRARGAAVAVVTIGFVAVGFAAGKGTSASAPDEPVSPPPRERVTQMPIGDLDNAAELLPQSDCSFLAGVSSVRHELVPSDSGWSARWSSPSGSWFPDGAGSIAWRDTVLPAGFGETAATTEQLTLLERAEGLVVVRIDHHEFPEDGPDVGIERSCVRRIGFPEEHLDFLTSLRSSADVTPPTADDLDLESEPGVIRVTGSTSAPVGSRAEVHLELSSLAGTFNEVGSGTVVAPGRFGVGVPVRNDGLDCSVGVSIDGWWVGRTSGSCTEGLEPDPDLIEAVQIVDRIFQVTAPATVQQGGLLRFTLCGSVDGVPAEASSGFLTVGGDPGGPLASHSMGVFRSDGCYDGALIMAEPPGSVPLLVSDGVTSELVLEIDVTDPLLSLSAPAETPSRSESPGDDPAVDDPATDDAATDDPATDDPATDDPATDDPATDDPATADAAADDARAADEVADEVAEDQPATGLGDSPVADASDKSGDDGGGFPIWIPIVVGLGLVIGGYWVYRSRLGGTTLDLPSTSEVTTADLEQYRDGDLGRSTDVYAAPPSVASGDSTTDGDWLALRDREDDIQEIYLADFRALLEEVGEGYQAYHAAITDYQEKFVKITSASTDLQGYLRQWHDTQKIAKWQDLAYGVVTLVWGIGSLGAKAFRWLKSPGPATSGGKSVTSSALGSADEAATGDTILGEAATIIDDGRPLRELDAAAIDGYAAEIGVSWDDWLARHAFDVERADLALRRAVGVSRGWHGITDNAAGVINRLLVNGRSAVAGRMATIDPNDLAQLRRWAQVGGFWDHLLTTAGDMGAAGIALFYTADDVKFLRALLQGSGDVAAVRAALGPAQTSALEVADEVIGSIPSLTGLTWESGKATFTAGNVGWTAGSLYRPEDAAGDLDLASYTNQFGGWAQPMNEGFFGLGKFVMWWTWGFFTSPFELYHGITMTAEAMDRYAQFLEGSQDDLSSMGSSTGAAIDAIRSIAGSLDRADLDDPTSSLGGARAAELRIVAGEMDDLLQKASNDWKAKHADVVESRIAHVLNKIQRIERILDALDAQRARLGQLAAELDAARRLDDGSLRPVVELWNPSLLVVLASTDLVLQGIIGSSLHGASQPSPPGPTSGERPPLPDLFAEGYDPYRDFDASVPHDDAAWEAELDEVFTVRTQDGN